MIERSGTSDSPHTLMVRAAAEVLRDWGYTRDDTVDGLDGTTVMAATEAIVLADTGDTWQEFITEALADPRLKGKFAASIGGDHGPFAWALSDKACQQAEYIIAEALQTLSSREEIEWDRHVDQQIKQAKEIA